MASKAHRSCPDEYLEAARRGDRAKVGWPAPGWLVLSALFPVLGQASARRALGCHTQVKACFVIDVDEEAFIAAAQGKAAVEDFFYR